MKILSDIYQSTLEKIRYSNSKFLSSDIVTEFKGRSSNKKIAVTRNGLKVMRDEKGIVTIDLFDFLLNEDSLDW